MSFLPIGYLDEVWRNPAAFRYGSIPKVVKLAAGILDDANELARAADAARVIVLQNGSRFPAMVQIAFTHDGIPAVWSSAAALLRSFDDQREILRFLPQNGFWTQTDLYDLQKLLRNLAGGGRAIGTIGQLSADHMRELFGFARRIADDAPPQWISMTDMIQGAAMFARIVGQEALDFAPTPAQVTALKNNLWEVPGLATAAGVYLCRSGYGWGARLEIRTIAVRLINSVDPSNLRMSLPMPDGKLGPDIAEYIDRGAGIVVDLWQCKAFKNFGSFAGNRATNEPLRQIFSDISRFGPEGWSAAARGADAAGSTVPLSGVYKFTFDFDHFWQNAADPLREVQNAALSQGLVISFNTFGKSADEIRHMAAVAMRQVMQAQVAEIRQTISALTETGPLLPSTLDNLGHVINNQIARRYKDGAKPARLALADITPQKLLDEGFITADELAGFVELAATNGDGFLREAAKKALGLTPEMIDTMPSFDVGMELVMKGTANGFFDPAVDVL
jgi:hypothetical protein